MSATRHAVEVVRSAALRIARGRRGQVPSSPPLWLQVPVGDIADRLRRLPLQRREVLLLHAALLENDAVARALGMTPDEVLENLQLAVSELASGSVTPVPSG